MLLDVSRALRAPMEEFPFLHREELAPQDICGEVVTFDVVTMAGKLAMAGDRLVLRGKLSTVAHAQCANCLAPVALPMSVPFEESFLRQEKNVPGGEETDDPDRLAFEGSNVELSHLALTLVLLELPMRFLCAGGCENGLDRITQDASAIEKEPSQTRPFSALRQLLEKAENQEE